MEQTAPRSVRAANQYEETGAPSNRSRAASARGGGGGYVEEPAYDESPGSYRDSPGRESAYGEPAYDEEPQYDEPQGTYGDEHLYSEDDRMQSSEYASPTKSPAQSSRGQPSARSAAMGGGGGQSARSGRSGMAADAYGEPSARSGVYESPGPAKGESKPLPASMLRREAPPDRSQYEVQEEYEEADEEVVHPAPPGGPDDDYAKKNLAGKKNFGILSRRERILNVRYMTDSIKETSKNQNTLLESKVRSLFIQHLREEDAGAVAEQEERQALADTDYP